MSVNNKLGCAILLVTLVVVGACLHACMHVSTSMQIQGSYAYHALAPAPP